MESRLVAVFESFRHSRRRLRGCSDRERAYSAKYLHDSYASVTEIPPSEFVEAGAKRSVLPSFGPAPSPVVTNGVSGKVPGVSKLLFPAVGELGRIVYLRARCLLNAVRLPLPAPSPSSRALFEPRGYRPL